MLSGENKQNCFCEIFRIKTPINYAILRGLLIGKLHYACALSNFTHLKGFGNTSFKTCSDFSSNGLYIVYWYIF